MNVYENIVKKNKKMLEKGNFDISEEEIASEFEAGIQSYKYKIPQEYLEFYKKVSFEEILNSAEKYFKELIEKLETEKDIEIHFEERIKLSSEKELFENVFINGVTD